MKTEPDMVPPRSPSPSSMEPLLLEEAEDATPLPRRTWVRLFLVFLVSGWMGVFAVAAWLNPYRDGRVWLEETHRQAGLPPCTFKALYDLPCPSCGMTSSFALLVRGDLVNSLRANFAGTLLALVGVAFIPWSIVSMLRGRWLWFRDVEWVLIRIVLAFVVVMLVRWVGLLAWIGLTK